MKKRLRSFSLFCCFLVGSWPVQAASLRLIGRAALPHEMPVGKTKVGGLSGISYDAATKTFWAISDDSSYKGGAPRAYQLSLNLDGQADLQPKILGALILRDEKGAPFPVADCEGIACTGRGGIWVTSEGRSGKTGAPPFLRLFSLANGRTVRAPAVPTVYLPRDAANQAVPIGDPTQTQGIVTNKSLESCALSPDLGTVFIANETSLLQEKAPGEGSDGGASVFNNTQIRISALDAKTGRLLTQKMYQSDAGCLFGSISDMAALDNQSHLLVLERRVVRLQEGTGSCGIRIYAVDLAQAGTTDLRQITSVAGQEIVNLGKTLVYDSKKEGIDDLDNVEGIGLVPLPGGKTGLVAVSDDNFNEIQQTQILLYEYLK